MSVLDDEDKIASKALESELKPIFQKFLDSPEVHDLIYASLHIKFSEMQTQIDMLKDRINYLEFKLDLTDKSLKSAAVGTDLLIERDSEGNIENVLLVKTGINS